MFWGEFWPGLDGYEEIKNPDVEIFRSYLPDIAAFQDEGSFKPGESMLCTGKIRHVGSTYIKQWEYLKSLVPAERHKELKLTLAAPNWYHLRYREGRAYPRTVYSNDKEYFADIAKAYQAELKELYEHGVRNIQFDDPNFACQSPYHHSILPALISSPDFCSEPMLAGWKKDHLNTKTTDQLLDEYIQLYNDCVSQAPADMHVGLHICRGNYINSRHFSEGGYDRIATKLFKSMNMHTYYLEYDTPRAGGFEPLKELPPNKNVIVGVITSKFPKLEDVGAMKERVFQAADFIAKGNGETREQALRRLGVSPQCGFASHSSGNAIDREGMINKLKLVRELADSIWPGEP